jgi:hypothetical protein
MAIPRPTDFATSFVRFESIVLKKSAVATHGIH